MSEIIRVSATGLSGPVIALPPARKPMRVRTATQWDIPFIDGMQKKHSRQLGFFPREQMLDYVNEGNVLLAQDDETSLTIGYVISRDRYLKRDELGAIFQMCVLPRYRRSLVAANLLREVFERSSYGCRLYCLWCAQDLVQSSAFWQSMGFVPIAYRVGGEKKSAKGGVTQRVHIFWQKRIREGDTGDLSQGGTPWWYPSKTDGGAIREDRIVLPIPPGMRWDDDLPLLTGVAPRTDAVPALPSSRSGVIPASKMASLLARSEARFGRPGWTPAVAPKVEEVPAPIEVPKPPARKCDRSLVSKARELRDKWAEQVNASGIALPSAKYDVAKRIGDVAQRIAA